MQTIDVVEHDRPMTVLIGLQKDAKGSGMAANPACLVGEGLADGAALTHSGIAKDHQQVQVPISEGTDIVLQFGVARHTQGVRR